MNEPNTNQDVARDAKWDATTSGELIVVSPGATLEVLFRALQVCEYCFVTTRLFPISSVQIVQAVAKGDANRLVLDGSIRTICYHCGKVVNAVQRYTEFEFADGPCPAGHRAWKAVVTRISRNGDDFIQAKPLEYEFEIELRCKECEASGKGLIARFVKRIASALARIKKLKVTATGVEVEQRDDSK